MKSQKVASYNMALKVAIAESGRTQRAIAKAARMDETRLSRIVRQQVVPFKHEQTALARVLGSSVGALFVPPPATSPEGQSEEAVAS